LSLNTSASNSSSGGSIGGSGSSIGALNGSSDSMPVMLLDPPLLALSSQIPVSFADLHPGFASRTTSNSAAASIATTPSTPVGKPLEDRSDGEILALRCELHELLKKITDFSQAVKSQIDVLGPLVSQDNHSDTVPAVVVAAVAHSGMLVSVGNRRVASD
jgi:hypothetical protein